MAFNVPEQYRVKRGPFATKVSDGNNGFFVIPSPGGSIRMHLQCLASDCRQEDYVDQLKKVNVELDGNYWEHVSISIINITHSGKTHPVNRCPTWEEMCYIKTLFWDDPDDIVLQFHPPESEYVSNNPYCLHLWRAVGADNKPVPIPCPPSQMVGLIPKKNTNPTPNETKPQTHSADQSPAEKS